MDRMIMIRIGADGKPALVEMEGVAQGAGKMGDGVSKAAAKSAQDMRSFHLSVTDAEKALLSIGGSVGTLYAIQAVISSSVDAANRMEKANIGLAVTARYAGESIDEVTRAAKSLTADGLMSVTEASQALQNLLSRGFSLPEATEMMKRFKDSAAFNRQAALEFGQAIVGATEGLKNENSVLVDNAGVTKNVSIMWKEYAAEHGKTADSLTQAEKRQAEYNGILKETEGQIGNAVRMTNTFQGAQAKLNQDLFEFKATLGSAVQPALQGTLTILNPVVGGIRDMVYWVETLGASAGATWDKLSLRAELALSGKGMFSQEGLTEYDRRVKEINANLDATIADIVRKADGANLPDIGVDTGKRRQDTILPDDKAAKAAAKAREKAAKENADILLQMEVDTINGRVAAWVAGEKTIAEMEADAVKGRIASWVEEENIRAEMELDDISGRVAGWVTKEAGLVFWADARRTSDQAELQDTREFLALKASLSDGGHQQELFRISQEEAAWVQSYAMNTDSFEVHEQRKAGIEAYYSQKRQQLARDEMRIKMGYISSGFAGAASLTDAFYQLSGKKNKAAFRAYQLMKSGEIVVSTASSASKAFDDGAKTNYWLGVAYAAGAVGFGGVQMANLWSASDTGGGSMSASAAGSPSSSTPSSSTPTSSDTTNQAAPTLNVHIYGNVVDHDQFARQVIPAIQKAWLDGAH